MIVSAVFEPEDSVEEWWEKNHQKLDDFDENFRKDGEVVWHMCKGEIRSEKKMETYPVRADYHSGRDGRVIEVIFSGREDIKDIQISGLENVLEEINERFDDEFTIEVYYWYNGVDKPGGVSS